MKTFITHKHLPKLNHEMDVKESDCVSDEALYAAIRESGLEISARFLPLLELRKKILAEFERRKKDGNKN